MTIDEALRYNRMTLDEMERQLLHHRASALRLGNEALKAVGQWNEHQMPQHQFHLPGETKD